MRSQLQYSFPSINAPLQPGGDNRLHYGLKRALGRSLGININFFPLHCSFTTVWRPIQGEIDITVGFFAVLPSSYVNNTRTIEREIFPGALFEKNRFFTYRKGGGNTDSCELYWLNFWFHIVNLGKIPFHLIGRTLYFCKEFKFSFFESPLQKSNSGSKYETFISLPNHIVWPIKWKEILLRITIWNQKMSQYISQESVLPPPLL